MTPAVTALEAVAQEERSRRRARCGRPRPPPRSTRCSGRCMRTSTRNDDVEVVDVSEIEETRDDELVVDEAGLVEETSVVEAALTVDEVVEGGSCC